MAIKDWEKAVALNPEDSEAYANIGTAWLIKKAYSNAISKFTKAIQLNPNYADAYLNRYIAYAKINQDNASLRDAKRFIQIALQQWNHQGTKFVNHDLFQYRALL